MTFSKMHLVSLCCNVMLSVVMLTVVAPFERPKFKSKIVSIKKMAVFYDRN
jgi:hypothetical protein